jgi:hypothetical protein
VALRCAAQVRQAPAVIASDPMSPMSPRISPDKPMVRYAPQRTTAQPQRTTAHHSAARQRSDAPRLPPDRMLRRRSALPPDQRRFREAFLSAYAAYLRESRPH